MNLLIRSHAFLVIPFALTLVLLAGCNPGVVNVSGKVTFNGEPVPEGDIVFRGEEKAMAGKIKDGSYSMQAPAGKSTVEITAYRDTGKIDRSNPGEESPVLEMYIPEKYNSKSTLTADTATGSTFPFELEGKPAEKQ